MEKTMDKIVALAKSRGFVYPGSEIYGELEFLCREPSGCVVECPFHLVCIDKLLY